MKGWIFSVSAGIIITFFVACGETSKEPEKYEETAGQNLHIYNTGIPLKGTIALQLESLLEISSKEVSVNETIAFFNGARKDSLGNTYIIDRHGIRVYKFDRTGKFVKSFLKRGDGPGELDRVHDFSIINDIIYCSNRRKLCCFDMDGRIMKDVQFPKQYPGIIAHVDENRYITYYSLYKNDKTIGSACILVDVNSDKSMIELFRKMRPNIGFSTIKLPGKDFNYITDITPRIQYRYDPHQKMVYCFFNYEYTVYAIDLQARLKTIVHREHNPERLTGAELDAFADSFRRQGWPDYHIEMFRKNPPEECWPSIGSITLLPRGYFGVIRNTSREQREMDIFGPDGRFIYIIKESGEIKDIVMLNFFDDRVGIIYHREDIDVYKEFRVMNLPGIYLI